MGGRAAAFHLLTIGDGIATQLPALIISVATGIIVTRSAADRELSTEVFRQLGSVPRIPLIVAAVLMVLLLLPGMPKWPIAVIATLAFAAWWRTRRAAAASAAEADGEEVSGETAAAPALEIRLGEQLTAAWKGEQALVMDRIAGLRRVHEEQFGLAFPAVRLEDGAGLGAQEYEVRLFGARYGAAEIYPERVLAVASQGRRPALDGIETTDPAFGLTAWWIDPATSDAAKAQGCTIIDPLTVLVTHFGEIVRGEVGTLLTRAAMVALLDGIRRRQPGLVEELVPQILSVSDIQRVLQALLAEGVSIANLDLVVEHLVDLARAQKEPGELTELVRQRLSYAICHQLRGRHADLAVLSLDPRVENQLSASLGAAGGGGSLAIEPRLAEQLIRRLAPMTEEMFRQGRAPVLLCGAKLRRHLKALTRRSLPMLSVLSVSEIPTRITLKSFDIVRLEQ